MATNGISPATNETQAEDFSSKVEKLRPTVPQDDKRADAPKDLPERDGERQDLSVEDLEKVTEFLNESTKLFDLSIQFKVAEETDRIVISVFNEETDELIRQIPSDEILALSKRLNEMAGILFNETA